MAKSVINTLFTDGSKKCFICNSTYNIEKHHCVFGRAERKKAESDGLWLYLCANHHYAVHNSDAKLKKNLQELAQRFYMKVNNASEEDFIKRYGRSYLNGTDRQNADAE